MELTDRQMFDLARLAFVRLDGAWFLGAVDKVGLDTAWELDLEAWRRFTYTFGKHIRKTLIPEPVWPQSLIDAIGVLSRILMIADREFLVDGDTVTIRATDCEIQRMIAKAGVAECGVVSVQTYHSITHGLFGEDLNLQVEHTKNLTHGDDVCEIVVAKV